MKTLKTNLRLVTLILLLFTSSIAFGQHIKPIGRTITEKGDTITIFSIQDERRIVYLLSAGQHNTQLLESLQQVDSSLTVENVNLREKTRLLETLSKEQASEIKLHIQEKRGVQSELNQCNKKTNRLKLWRNVFIITTSITTTVSGVLLVTR